MKTRKGYKLCRMKHGELFAMFVNANKPFPIGEWIYAEEGERKDNGKVKSRLGDLAYRPGFHITDLPFTDWIGKRMEDGTLAMKPGTVWVEVEYCVDKNYNPEARERGWRGGRWARQRAQLDYIPKGGFYDYYTNSKQEYPWHICGEMRVIRIVPNDEVATICRAHGVEPQKVA